MQALFLRVAALSLGCSAVLLPLLLLSRRIHHRYAARTGYFLWLLLALRLIVPFQLSLPRPVVTVEAPNYEAPIQRPAPPVQVQPVTVPGTASLPAEREPSPAAEPEGVPAVSLTAVAGGLWLAGGAVFALWQGASYLLARRRLLARSVPARAEDLTALEEGKRALDLRRPVELRRVEALPTPMMLGLFRPVILLPQEELGEEARAMVLRHELVHLRRNDVAYKLLLLLANAVHWFNPLVWWMSREAGRNLELCCDDDVVRGQDGAFRRRYGEILIHTAAGCRAPALSTYFGGGKRHLKGRLKNLFQHKKNSAVLVCVVLAAALLAGSLVVCRAAGEGRISESEAIDRLEQSVRYDGETGVLSFTIPGADVPSQPWQLEIAGRAVFEDGMSMSVHYHTDTEWEPGETYTENLAQVADHLTELFIHVTLGIVERPIDVLPYVRPGAVSQGKTEQPLEDMTPEEQAVEALVQSITYREDGDLWFTLPDYGAPEDWRIRITGRDANGSGHSHGHDCDYHYLEHETLQPGMTYAMGIPSGHWAELNTLELRVWLGDTFRLVDLMAYVSVPRSGVYSMEPPEGAETTGDLPMTPKLTIDAENRRFQLFSDVLSSYLPIGSYTVEGNVVTCATDDGARRYVFEIEDGDTLRFDQGESSKMDHYDTSLAVPAYDGARFRWTGGVPVEVSDTGGTVYTNETYGFTLQLPESWAGHWRAEEDGRQIVFSAANIGETLDGVELFELNIEAEKKETTTAREHLLGHKDGCWVYSYDYPSDSPVVREASEEERSLYWGIIYDKEGALMPLTFNGSDAAAARYVNDLYGFVLQLPEEWGEDCAITEVGDEEVSFDYAGFKGQGSLITLVMQQEPLQSLGEDTRLLGSREGCYVYLYDEGYYWSEDNPEQAKIDRYTAVYEAMTALTERDFAFYDPVAEPQRDIPEFPGVPREAVIAALEWVEDRSDDLGDDYSFRDGRIDNMTYAWTSGGYTAYRLDFSLQNMDGTWVQNFNYQAAEQKDAVRPYLVMKGSIFWEVEFVADQTRGAFSGAMEGFRAVMTGRAGYVDPKTGTRVKLSTLDVSGNPNKTPYSAISNFAIIDLDQDGTMEVILDRVHGTYSYVLLHFEDGEVYGYHIGYRWFMPLKEDGSILRSGGAADDGMGRFRFANGVLLSDIPSYRRSHAGWSVMEYYVDGRSATAEEYYAAWEAWDAKPNAQWYDFTEEMINLHCTA